MSTTTLSPAARPVPTQTVPTACPLDCPDNCCLDVTVEDGRVTKIEGARRHALTDGFICSKVRGMARHLDCPERLLQPARRRGAKGEGDFEAISWDEAFDLVAERLRETAERHGGEAILPFCYGGSNGFLSQGTTDARLFRRLGASRLAQTVCAACTSAASKGIYGKMPGVAPEDYVETKMIVVWGFNPSVSGIHLVPVIQEAQRRGAKLMVVDPRAIPLAKKADVHLALRPGTDLVVALAVHRWLFENGAADLDFLAAHATGVDEFRRRAEPWTLERAAEEAGVEAADLERFARLYAETSPAVVRCGWGPERNRNGGSAIASILALPATAGKFGVRGGGYTMSNSGTFGLSNDELVGADEADTRELNMNRLGRQLLDAEPPVHALFVYNANPLATLPEQAKVRDGLLREDLFTVVFDSVMTDTARYADVVLPAATFLERREMTGGYGAMTLQSMQPVVEPMGEARTNHDVFAELCRRLGLEREGDVVDVEEWHDALLAQSEQNLAAELADGGVARPSFGACPISFVDVFPGTADGKIHLVPEDLDREAEKHGGLYTYQGDPAAAEYPLALISPASHRTICSTFGQLYRKQVPVELDADDAAARGIASGDTVRVWNDLGEVLCKAQISAAQRPGTAFLPKGIWSHNTLNGWTANVLTPATYTDVAEGACFNDVRVEIEKVDDPAPGSEG